jgi:hypothetical protein
MPPCLLAATSLRSLEVRHSSALMRSAIDSMRSVSDFPHPHLLIFLCFTVTHLVTLRTAGRFVVSTQWLCQIGYMYLLLVGTHAFHEGGRISIMLQVVPRLQYILSVYRCLFACNVLFGVARVLWCACEYCTVCCVYGVSLCMYLSPVCLSVGRSVGPSVFCLSCTAATLRWRSPPLGV